MADTCTIYSRLVDYGAVLEVLKSSLIGVTLEVRGSSSRWDKIILRKPPPSTLTFTSLEFREPMDKAAKLQLATANFVNRIQTTAVGVQCWLVKFIYSSDLILGVVADPSFEAEEDFIQIAADVAERLRAVVFWGSTFATPDGAKILDDRGGSDAVGGGWLEDWEAADGE